jgi:predicted nucleotidyltransferase
MSLLPLPSQVNTLASALAGLPGVLAVVLGGSRAAGTHRADSDWDLGIYYRQSGQTFHPSSVRGLGYPGYVSELGEWGPIVDGGAWLTIDETPVDVLFRDLDAIETWTTDSHTGRFEVLVQNGYIVGAPTYLPVGELAICQRIFGDLPRPAFPDALAASAAARWSGRASVSLMFAESYASASDTACCAGMLVDAALCVGHARLAQRREWVLNEKRLLDRAGLADIQQLLASPGGTSADLTATVEAISHALDVRPLNARG